MGVRGWPAWCGLWAAGAVGLLFALATPEALDLLPHAPRVVDQVTAEDTAIAAVPLVAATTVPFLVGLACWRRSPVVTRACLVACAGGLGTAVLVVPGIPDAGPWQPWVLAAAAASALLGAVLGTGPREGPSHPARLLVSGGLMVVGAVVGVLGWRGLSYQHWSWSPGVTGPMWAALAGGAVLVLLGLVGHRLPDAWWTAAPVLVVLLAGALVALVWATSWMLSLPFLDRHEESESAWETLPQLVVGTGLLAGGTALVHRWWSTAALSAAGGVAVGAAVVARDPDLWRLMW